MARTFRRHRQAHPIAELNVTNLIDLGFTLLIIFMIATPLINQEQTIPLNLPLEAKGAQPKRAEPERFESISVDAKGAYFFHDRQVTFPELAARLKELGALSKAPVIRVRADSNVPFQKFVSVMAELKKNNLVRIQIDTQAAD